MQPPSDLKEIKLLEGVQGNLYFTLGYDATLIPYDLIPGMAINSGILSQALFLDDENSGATINGRLAIDSNGAGDRPLRLVYNGAAFPSSASFTLSARLNDIAWVGLNKADVFSYTQSDTEATQGASFAWATITPIPSPSVASVTPLALVADGKDQAVHVNLQTPVEASIKPTLTATFSPSSAFLPPSRSVTGLSTATGPVVQEQRDTNDRVTGWIIYFATAVTPSSASLGLSVSATPTYLKGDLVVTETIPFFNHSYPLTFQKDQNPPEVVSITFESGGAYSSSTLDPGGSSALLSGTSSEGVPYVISKGRLRIHAKVRSLQNDFGSATFELRDYKLGTVASIKTGDSAPSWGSAITYSSPTSEVDPQDQKLYYVQTFTWEILLSWGDLYINALSHVLGVKFTAQDASGNQASLNSPTMIFDGNIYKQENMGKAFILTHPTYPNVSKSASALLSGTLGSSFTPLIQGWFTVLASEYQHLRATEILNGVSPAGFVSSCDIWLDGAFWKSSSAVSSDLDYSLGWTFGPFDSRTLSNGAHRFDFEFKSTYGVIAKTGFSFTVSNITTGGGGGGCVDYLAQIRMGDLSTKNAIDIVVGDMILTQNPLTGDLEISPVGEIIMAGVQPCFLLTFSDGSTHVCSSTHRIFVADNHSYMETKDLTIGMTLMGTSGPRMIVAIQAVEERPTLTYRVNDPTNKNYFADDVLAHNMKGVDCVLPGTPCLMADGSSIPVEDVLPGDWVMSFDESNLTFVPGRVLSLFSTKNGDLLRLTFNDGKTLVCSKTHVLLPKTGWTSVSNLTPGTEVMVEDGTYRTILFITPCPMSPDTMVYIMEVEGNHNLVLGGIVCHNYVKHEYDLTQVNMDRTVY